MEYPNINGIAIAVGLLVIIVILNFLGLLHFAVEGILFPFVN